MHNTICQEIAKMTDPSMNFEYRVQTCKSIASSKSHFSEIKDISDQKCHN